VGFPLRVVCQFVEDGAPIVLWFADVAIVVPNTASCRGRGCGPILVFERKNMIKGKKKKNRTQRAMRHRIHAFHDELLGYKVLRHRCRTFRWCASCLNVRWVFVAGEPRLTFCAQGMGVWCFDVSHVSVASGFYWRCSG